MASPQEQVNIKRLKITTCSHGINPAMKERAQIVQMPSISLDFVNFMHRTNSPGY